MESQAHDVQSQHHQHGRGFGEPQVTDAPGLGVELDPEICEQYLFPGGTLF